MLKYHLHIKASAQKAIDDLDNALAARILLKIEALMDNPRPQGVKKLRGFRDSWRIRVGDYRIIYTINDAIITIEVVKVAHRREVYE